MIAGIVSLFYSPRVEVDEALERATRAINRVGTMSPDYSFLSIGLTANTWKPLEKQYAVGVNGILLSDGASAVFEFNKTSSEILPHSHSKEHQYISVLSGSLIERKSKKILSQGDKMIIYKGEDHHLVAASENTRIYCVFSNNLSNLPKK